MNASTLARSMRHFTAAEIQRRQIASTDQGRDLHCAGRELLDDLQNRQECNGWSSGMA